MSTRANLIECKGLVTNSNELAVSPGSLRQATNVNVDEKGVITPRRGFNDYGGPTTGSASVSDITKQIIEYKDRIFRHFSDKIEFEDNAGAFQSISGVYNELVTGYRIKWQESKGNMYFTTASGIKRISLKDNSSLTAIGTVTIEDAGIPKAAYMEAAKVNTVGGFLPAQSKVGYRFIFGRKDENNNLLLGSASARTILENTNTDTIVNEDFVLDIAHATTAIDDSDYVLVSTLNTKTTFWFETATTGGTAIEPIDSNTIGTTFVKVDISGVSSNNDVAAILANSMSINLPEYVVTLASNQVTCVSTEEGNLDNNIITLTNAGSIVESARTQGSVTTGTEATADITCILPSTIDTNYFIQVYRTNYISVSLGLTLADLDPGDEMNLVYEVGVTTADIAAGEVTFNDANPESFRASAAPLYSNEITGEGILQSNDRPPIALDIELFRNSMFYANTKSSHRLEFTILSVDDFVNNTTKIVVGNSTISRYYTAAAAESADTTPGGDFKLSVAVSVAQAIDETTRSLVKIINQDTGSPVNAYYLSGADDLPGQVLLEARSLVDTNFYISIEETTFPVIGTEISPALPEHSVMERLNGTGPATNVKVTGHGYVTGNEVYVSFLNEDPVDADAPVDIAGVFQITKIDNDNFTIPVINLVAIDSTGASPFSTATSTVFSPDVESDNLEAANRLYYSKTDEPEAVPAANYINVGAQDEPIRRILALRDSLFVLKDDGVFIVSGTSAPNFSVRQTDSTSIVAPDSAAVLNNQIYCLTAQGISKINGSGQVGIISRGIEDLVDEVANASFDFVPNTFGIPYENDRSYMLFMPQVDSDTSATQAYRYNIFERTWTKWEYEATCGHVMTKDAKLYLGNGDRNYISQERKNFEREDHSDRDFTTTIVTSGITENIIELGSLLDIEVSDVITQEQEVTIDYINNRILRRMDEFDTGIVTSMLATYAVVIGDNMAAKVQIINDHLVTLDASNITAKSINSSNLRTQMELLVTELNTAATITTIKTYANPETITYEAYITSIDVSVNKVTMNIERPFLAGTVSVFKHFVETIEWNPQHFGDPSALKQVREVTVLLDQNNFYNVKLKFGSDVAQNLVEVDKSGKGIGYWGDMPWGDPNHYWGGTGNDIPLRTIVPRGKQKCRYITIVFEHKNARESFRILGISGVVRQISSRAYK